MNKKKKKKKKASKFIKRYAHLIDDKSGLGGDPDAQFNEDAIAEAEMRRVLRNLQNWVRSVMGEPDQPQSLPGAPNTTPASAFPPTSGSPNLSLSPTPGFRGHRRSPSIGEPSISASNLNSVPSMADSLSPMVGREFEDLLALSPWKPVMMERGRDRAAIIAIETDPPEPMLHRIRMNGLVEATVEAATAAFANANKSIIKSGESILKDSRDESRSLSTVQSTQPERSVLSATGIFSGIRRSVSKSSDFNGGEGEGEGEGERMGSPKDGSKTRASSAKLPTSLVVSSTISGTESRPVSGKPSVTSRWKGGIMLAEIFRN
ncbi:hypothetical protein HDU67_003469 [Dinochytrium kinnereticum]|nr:hypothetical protein HDU67_003469 [Dinochytrium kinnereticum]